MHSGWIIPDGVLPTKEDARRVLDHVVALARVAGDDWSGEDVVVVATCASRDKAVTAPLESKSWDKNPNADKNCQTNNVSKAKTLGIWLPAPRISSPPGDNRFFGRWHIGGAKDAFEDGNAATHDHVVRHVLHDGGGLPSHKGEQHRCLVEVLVFFWFFSLALTLYRFQKRKSSPLLAVVLPT